VVTPHRFLLNHILAIASMPNGEILVARDADLTIGFQNEVIRIDPSTGDRTLVSSNSVGTGPPFDTVRGITGIAIFPQLIGAAVPTLGPGLLALVFLAAGATLLARQRRRNR
jgi:hypothetical protein